MQHGPLITFHLNLTQGNAVVRYSSKDEAAKAQKSLHMYVCRCVASKRRSSFNPYSSTCAPSFLQVRAWEHHHPGRVCRGGGCESLLCTGPVARRNDQLAGHSRRQSNKDGWERVRSISSHRPLAPLEQQQRQQQQQ